MCFSARLLFTPAPMAWHSTVSISGVLKRLKGSRYIIICSIPSVSGTVYSPLTSLSYTRGIWVKILICQTSTDTYLQMRETFWSIESKRVDNDYKQPACAHNYQRFHLCVMKLVVMLCLGLSYICKALWSLDLTWCHVFLDLNIYCSLSKNMSFVDK